jgi:Sulfotransferase family
MQPESISEEAPVRPLTAEEKAEKIKQAEEIVQRHHFVFLGGLHRSGTTLLFRMLREHPAISGFVNNQDANEWLAAEDEGQYLQSVYPPAIFWGGPGKFAFSPDAHLTEQSELLTTENRAKLPLQWSPYWDLSKHFLLEKSPPNLVWTRFLQSIFPNSSFVILVRHPVANALATEKWSPTGLSSLIEHWLVAHDTFEIDRPYLRRVMTIKYEAMVSDPAAARKTIYGFLGLESHPTTFQPTQEHNQKYFAQWRELAANPETGGVIQECIDRLEPRVRAYGYSLQDLEIR